MTQNWRSYGPMYSEERFQHKLLRYARVAGREAVERALQLYYAAQSPSTPGWARAAIYGALGYFITPLDAVPDFIPFAGFGDDLGVLVAAMAAVALYVTPEIKRRAAEKAADWFGER